MYKLYLTETKIVIRVFLSALNTSLTSELQKEMAEPMNVKVGMFHSLLGEVES
jgi:hypothetical protein